MAIRDWMTPEETIDHIATSQGVSRRKARKMLATAQREGKITVTGVSSKTGKREAIPPGKMDERAMDPAEWPSRLLPITGPAAANMLAEDPESVAFSVTDLMLQFGFSEHELMAELRAERLVAKGRRTPQGFADINVSAGAFCRWLEDDDAPAELRARIRAKLYNKLPETRQ